MKRPLLLLASVCFLSLTGCSKDDAVDSARGGEENPMPEGENPNELDEPEDLVYFTFDSRNEQDNSSLTEKRWIAVHDSDGQLLDYKKVEYGATVVFESDEKTVTDKITISLVSTSQFDDGPKRGKVETFMEIDRGTVWGEREYISWEQAPKTFTFEANNVPEWSMFSLSSKDSFVWELSDFYSFSYPDVQEGNLLRDGVPMYEDEDFIFSLVDSQGTTKYQRLLGVQDQDTVSVDASELLDFDQTVSVDVTQAESVNFFISGLTEKESNIQTQFLAFYFTLDNPEFETIEFGYLDDTDNYRSELNFSLEDYYYSYSKVGSPISSFAIPPAVQVNITDDTSTDFQFTANAPYVYHSVSFGANEPSMEENNGQGYTSWTVSSPSDASVKLVTLPDGLLEESELYVGDFEYSGISLYTKSADYNDDINARFSNSDAEKIIPSEKEFFNIYPTNDESAKSFENNAFHVTKDEFLKMKSNLRFSEMNSN